MPTRGLLPKGGTMLGTRRGSPFDTPDGLERVKAAFTELVLDGLIVIGGNGTLTVAHMLYDQKIALASCYADLLTNSPTTWK